MPLMPRPAIALALSLACPTTTQDKSNPAPAMTKASAKLIDKLLAADAAGRRKILAGTQWTNSRVVTALLESAKLAKDKDLPRAISIVHLVGELGIGADAAAPDLIAFIDDPKRKKLKIGPAIRKPKSRLGPTAAVALGQLAPFAQEQREAVSKALEHELKSRYGFHIAGVRRAFFRTYVAANADITELTQHLTHNIPYVREAAAEALGSRRRESIAAVPSLAAAVSEDHPDEIKVDLNGWSGSSSAQWDAHIQLAAARALVAIAPADKRSHAAHLLVVRKESDPSLLITSLRHIGAMGKDGKPALARLCKLLEHANVRVAAEAVTALGMIGIKDDEVMAALKRASERPEKSVAARAAATIRVLK